MCLNLSFFFSQAHQITKKEKKYTRFATQFGHDRNQITKVSGDRITPTMGTTDLQIGCPCSTESKLRSIVHSLKGSRLDDLVIEADI